MEHGMHNARERLLAVVSAAIPNISLGAAQDICDAVEQMMDAKLNQAFEHHARAHQLGI
jgi:hypothetical protein